jgi:hypothetical protein
MKVSGGWLQAYNAQAMATQGQVIIAAEVTTAVVDFRELEPMLAVANANLASAQVDEPIGVVLADAGYYSTKNATLATTAELLIATSKAHKLPGRPSDARDRLADADRKEAELVARRAEVISEVAAGSRGTRRERGRGAPLSGSAGAMTRRRLTTFFEGRDGRTVLDAWARRLASFRTADIVSRPLVGTGRRFRRSSAALRGPALGRLSSLGRRAAARYVPAGSARPRAVLGRKAARTGRSVGAK